MNSRIERIVNATKYSMQGLRAALGSEKAVQEEFAILVPAVVLGLWIGETGVERALLIGSWMVVIITELLNSAVEAVVDRFGTEWNEYSKLAKDLGSAAVFMALALAAVVWGCIVFG